MDSLKILADHLAPLLLHKEKEELETLRYELKRCRKYIKKQFDSEIDWYKNNDKDWRNNSTAVYLDNLLKNKTPLERATDIEED